ncbi:helix-turn-helix domain-containing protein [Flagellimonas olearia]|uniref:Helix-turn-helix domain-containing protein n=1 Tax=Flagellimonas olearia TaxID=552546 RepID=A0A6I1DXU3_9FLAO|nr:helix-turn-helix domain-containing protein [Allomuricauda olearia]KAB7530376.1 helix-turn-helix domain-containing protein [Allomuricauda olearia]
MQKQFFYFPHPLLRNYIRYFWVYEHQKPESFEIPLKIMADRFPKLIVQNTQSKGGIKTAEGETLPLFFVSGVITKPLSYRISRQQSHLGVSFAPDTLGYMFGIKPNEQKDQFADISYFVPRGFMEALGDAGTVKDKITLLTNFFIEQLTARTFKENHGLVRNILLNFYKYRDFTVKAIADKNKVSERSLERNFKSFVGISPKKYLQLYRFEMTYKNLSSNTFESFAEVSYCHGYADQSHFIRNFKKYSGMLPTTFIRELKKEDAMDVMIWNYIKLYRM